MCFSNTKNLPYPRRNGFSTDWPMFPIATQKERGHMQSISLPPTWFSICQISLQIKKTGHRLITLEWHSMWTSGGNDPRWSVLPPDMGMKIAAWCWKKRFWLPIHNKVTTEQCFAVTSAKGVAVFKASLKVLREEPGAQISNKDNKHSTSQGSKCLWEGKML